MGKNILAALCAATLLAGCATTPEPGAPTVTPVQVPPLPAEFQQRAERLPDIVDRTLRAQVESGIEGDRAYNDLAFRYNKLTEIYECVRIALNQRTDPDKCLND